MSIVVHQYPSGMTLITAAPIAVSTIMKLGTGVAVAPTRPVGIQMSLVNIERRGCGSVALVDGESHHLLKRE